MDHVRQNEIHTIGVSFKKRPYCGPVFHYAWHSPWATKDIYWTPKYRHFRAYVKIHTSIPAYNSKYLWMFPAHWRLCSLSSWAYPTYLREQGDIYLPTPPIYCTVVMVQNDQKTPHQYYRANIFLLYWFLMTSKVLREFCLCGKKRSCM